MTEENNKSNGSLKIPTPWGAVEITGRHLILVVLILALFGGNFYQRQKEHDLISTRLETTNGLLYAICHGIASQDRDERERCTRLFINRKVKE
jgi:hypothetical protein